jgi:hypothetical protein
MRCTPLPVWRARNPRQGTDRGAGFLLAFTIPEPESIPPVIGNPSGVVVPCFRNTLLRSFCMNGKRDHSQRSKRDGVHSFAHAARSRNPRRRSGGLSGLLLSCTIHGKQRWHTVTSPLLANPSGILYRAARFSCTLLQLDNSQRLHLPAQAQRPISAPFEGLSH